MMIQPLKIFLVFNETFDDEKIDHLVCNAGISVKEHQDINLKIIKIYGKVYKTNYLSHRKIIEYI